MLELERKCKQWYPLSTAPAYFDTLASAGARAASEGTDALTNWIDAQVSDIQRLVFDMPEVVGACPEIFRPPGGDVVLTTGTYKSKAGEVQCLVIDS